MALLILILFAASLSGGFIFPWWWPAVTAYALGFWLPHRAGGAFASGFAGTALAWAAWAGFRDWRNHHLLSDRIAALFHLPAGALVLALTALVGGMVGGLSAWAGFCLRAYVKPRPAGVGAGAWGSTSVTGAPVAAAGSADKHDAPPDAAPSDAAAPGDTDASGADPLPG